MVRCFTAVTCTIEGRLNHIQSHSFLLKHVIDIYRGKNCKSTHTGPHLSAYSIPQQMFAAFFTHDSSNGNFDVCHHSNSRNTYHNLSFWRETHFITIPSYKQPVKLIVYDTAVCHRILNSESISEMLFYRKFTSRNRTQTGSTHLHNFWENNRLYCLISM